MLLMYNLNFLLENISDDNKKDKGNILSCLFLFAVRRYLLDDIEDALCVIQDLLILGDVKETSEWEVMEWAIFFSLFIRKIPAKQEETLFYIASYRGKLLENLKFKKRDYKIFLKKETNYGIKLVIKREIYNRLNGDDLENIREELGYNCKYESESEIWVSKIKEVSELIYLNYMRLNNDFNEVYLLIDELKVLAKNEDIPPFVDFMF